MIFYNVVILLFVISVVDYTNEKGKNGSKNKGSSRSVKKVLKHLGALTPYKFNANIDLTLGNENAGCTKKIWMIIGYGTSYPTERQITRMSEFLPQVRYEIVGGFAQKQGQLSYETIRKLDEWKPPIEDVKNARSLSQEGQVEMINLAKRMQRRFSNIFPKKFSNDTYLIKYAANGRIRDSARYFLLGLLDSKEELQRVFLPKPTHRDISLIRAHTVCQLYQDVVGDSEIASDDIENFYKSTPIQDVVDKINKFLGTTGLTDVEVELMYIACAYETGWKKIVSPWCYGFDLETIQPFEYVDDLVQYWYNGYAFKITTRLACLAIRDAVLFFNDRRNKRTANIYFTDISSVIHVLVHLGVYKGRKLTSKTFEMNSKKVWKASKIAGFANNVALIFYSCSGKQSISVIHNEKFVPLRACSGERRCDFSVFKKYHDASINKCNFDDMCEMY